jgi:hypothetical protein
MIRRINFFGGPGVGKTTLASRAFVMLSQSGQSVAQVQECVKQAVYAQREIKGWDCVLTAAQQLNAEYLPLSYGVQQIVSDSPLLLQAVYAQHYKCPAASQMSAMCFEFEKCYPSVNFLVQRCFPFQSEGRYQSNEGEALEIDDIIETGIACHCLPFTRIRPDMSDSQLESLLYQITDR